MQISEQTLRRFILGRQGLWPGRRWMGKDGAVQALRSVEAVQVDPLNVVARSHEIALWGRVLDFYPENLENLLYCQRQFFEYGGGLFIYPMEELPYWRVPMERAVASGRWRRFADGHPELLQQVRTSLQERGPLGPRDFAGNERVERNYRGRKDTSLALYYLWLSGEVMIVQRRQAERLYDFRQRLIPPELDYAVEETEAEAYFSLKCVAHQGLVREKRYKNSLMWYFTREVSAAEASQVAAGLIEKGALARVRVEGRKDIYLVLQEDLADLETLDAGGVPDAWSPLDTTTGEEVVFLAPLEIASARGRAADLFEFEYIWEVYKPADTRRWGYYTLPILYHDRLVGRLDPKLDRNTGTLQIKGFWLEPGVSADDLAFRYALARGLRRFKNFLGAGFLDPGGIPFGGLRTWLGDIL